VTHRDLEGFFDHVWSVHPLVGADPDEPSDSSIGRVDAERLAERHTFVEGRVARSRRLTRFPLLNFVLAQIELITRLDSIVRREGIGLVRAWDPFYSGLLAWCLARLNRLPLEIRINANYDALYESVGTLAYPRLFRSRRLEIAGARFTLSRADQVVVGSDDNRRYATANGADSDAVVYSGTWLIIHPDHHRPPAERQLPSPDLRTVGDPLIVAVSRLERTKHPEDVLQSLAKIREQNSHVRGLLVGDGSMRLELQAQAAELGVSDAVTFAGDRNQPWVARALTAADVVLAPLAGLTLVEAALSGTPIVAYDVEWHGEFLRSGEDCLLVPYRDTDAMAAAALRLLNDPVEAARIAGNARQTAERRMNRAEVLAHERAQAQRVIGRCQRRKRDRSSLRVVM
jgi:glycosyltransferase involved in cell wall biosynthesis